jgi:hypothetical protein
MPADEAQELRKSFPPLRKNATYADAISAMLLLVSYAGLARCMSRQTPPDQQVLRALQLANDFIQCNMPKKLQFEDERGGPVRLTLEQTLEGIARSYGLDFPWMEGVSSPADITVKALPPQDGAGENGQ